MDGDAGVMASEVKVAELTVAVVEPLTAPDCAEMVEVPVASAVASPVAEMAITELMELDQVTEEVRSSMEPSLNVPVAKNCKVSPLATEGFTGVTVMVESVACVTIKVPEPVTLLCSALMVVVPWIRLEARPCWFTVATSGLEEVHSAVLVKFCVEPSVNVPVATNC